MSYKKLEIWQLSRTSVIDIHKMTLTRLPKFELYEEGSQIRRSIKSVKSNSWQWLKQATSVRSKEDPLSDIRYPPSMWEKRQGR